MKPLHYLTISSFDTSSAFGGDEKRYSAKVAHTIILTLLVAAVAVLLSHLSKANAVFLWGWGVAFALLLVAFFALHRGQVLPVCVMLPIILTVFLTYQAYFGNGLHDLSVMGYPVVIVLAGLLLGKTAPLRFGGLCLVALVGLYWAETQGLIQTPYTSLTDPADLVTMSAILGVTAVLLRMVIGHLSVSLESARQHEEDLAKSNLQLASQNAELERFTYTVSHDLRSPLVTVRGFVGYLEKDAKAGNKERFEEDLRQIDEATMKMDQLLTDLLELSRIGRVVHDPEVIPFEALVDEALSLVAGRIQQGKVAVVVEPGGPEFYGDRLRLLEVLQNLIDNAVKFMGEQPDPKIVIGGRKEGGRHVYWVRDNGMGIAGAYLDKVFGLFERLEDKTEGTGIGLALVQRIVEIHGGEVRLESAGPGHGTTSVFSLPPVG